MNIVTLEGSAPILDMLWRAWASQGRTMADRSVDVQATRWAWFSFEPAVGRGKGTATEGTAMLDVSSPRSAN